MLESRSIIATLSGETLEVSVTRCPQGDVLSPMLWCLVVDGLLGELNEGGYYAIGYADDIAILINGKFPQTVSKVLQTALGLDWYSSGVIRQDCPSTQAKRVVMPFTKKREF
jgi:hypothetical protein